MIDLDRRELGRAGLAALAIGGLAACATTPGDAAAAELPEGNEVAGYGPLQRDPAGFFDLPAGFSYRILSRAGEAMDDGLVAPDHFDGMGCIPLPGGRLALIRNHELKADQQARGASGGEAARAALLARLPAYDHDSNGVPLAGGTTTLILDPTGARVERQFLSLAGTLVNCAGGVTPWGSWLSCEETSVAAPETGQSHGYVFEVPASAAGPVTPLPLKAMGRCRHEAAAVDPVTGIVYLTEDRDDSIFMRFLPDQPGRLAAGGRLEALVVDGIADARNWTASSIAVGPAHRVRWVPLRDVESPNDDLRLQGQAQGATIFARGEGIHQGIGRDGRPEFYFTCTSGGARRHGQIFRHRPGPTGGTLSLFHESRDPALMDYADNLTVAPWGHLIVCEDRSGDATNYLRGVTPQGRSYTLARLTAPTELAGACFSPDGETLFVNAYRPGRTLSIRGPWRSVRG